MGIESSTKYNQEIKNIPPKGDLSPSEKLKQKIEDAKERSSAKKAERLTTQLNTEYNLIQLSEQLNYGEIPLEKQADLISESKNWSIANDFVLKQVIPALQRGAWDGKNLLAA